jgi:hypothetical protein
VNDAQSSAPRSDAPEAVYRERRALASAEAGRRRGLERTVSHARLAVFVGALAIGWMVFGVRSWSAWSLAPAVALFVALMIVHDGLIRRRERAERRERHYDDGLARLENRWAGRGEAGLGLAEPEHPFAADLDVFGEGSLYERLCVARSPSGRLRLAEWLKTPATDVAEIRDRQAAVSELRDRVDLREDLALLGEDVASRFDVHAALAWGAGAVPPVPVAVRGACAAAVFATGATLAAWVVGPAPPLPFFGALLAQAALALALRRRTAPLVQGAERALRDLAILRDLLARIEAESVSSPKLVALQRALDTAGLPPSRRIEQLQRRVDLLDARRNQFFAPIGALLLWTTQIALSLEVWRAECGGALPHWIEASGEFEALAALSGYAYECPDDPFPELVEEGPLFDAHGLGHPLLPADRCVRNDLRIGGERRAWVVSGSNMSGKSTLLRSVGTNALLGLIGAPVRARSLRLSPLALGASIQVHDSLLEGRSRFYAEIERLHQIVQLAEGEVPALFLLDEILHGTNSHDRRIGAEALVKGLLHRGAVGLVTTHDLALAKLADEEGGAIENAHFEDHLEDGEIRFDYRLRPGVVRKSNALALMRAVGLEV